MRSKDLKAVMGEDSDEDLVVVDAFDHHYRKAGVSTKVHAELTKDGRIVQYFGDEHMEEGSEKISVTLIQ